MSGIVCAIRGGAASQPTIRAAIRHAKATGLPLHFLYVVNLDFLLRTTHSRTQVLAQELREMGEFILLVAASQAEAEGIEVEEVVREGHSVRDEIVALSHEVGADYVILGRPKTEGEENVFTHQLQEELKQHMAEETGAKVIFANEVQP